VSEVQPVLTLRRLQAEYPQLTITAEFCGRTRVWVARGGDGHHPWLVLSSDLARFRAALGRPAMA
jgi:hypothetical protein